VSDRCDYKTIEVLRHLCELTRLRITALADILLIHEAVFSACPNRELLCVIFLVDVTDRPSLLI